MKPLSVEYSASAKIIPEFRKMSVFSKFFRKRQPPVEEHIEEFTELPVEGEQEAKMNVIIEKLEGLSDADRVIKKARTGNIVIARIKELREQNVDELKHCISKIKTSAAVFQGDLAGVGDEWLLITPASVRINRDEAPA
ncbi:MAG: cell division protein SepF [Candidatus Aenigmarchaeota archaeon]|nr:cell division protein SepF [Candidatus Aenigmarchaeota archaeon]